jgi:uncharacterized protein with HEPN domain
MSRHESDIRLCHMLDHAKEAAVMVRGRARAQLDSDRQLNLSLVRLLEIVGEAAGRWASGRAGPPSRYSVPEIVGLRNRLIHGYNSVDSGILWQIVSDDLPPLIAALERALQALAIARGRRSTLGAQ